MVMVDSDLETFVLGDQPTTCGLCGARTDFDVEVDGTQIHQCLDKDCGCQFAAVTEDVEL